MAAVGDAKPSLVEKTIFAAVPILFSCVVYLISSVHTSEQRRLETQSRIDQVEKDAALARATIELNRVKSDAAMAEQRAELDKRISLLEQQLRQAK